MKEKRSKPRISAHFRIWFKICNGPSSRNGVGHELFFQHLHHLMQDPKRFGRVDVIGQRFIKFFHEIRRLRQTSGDG